MADRFKLYTISTNKTLVDIYNILLGKAPSVRDIGPLREAFVREKISGKYRKTNRIFVITTDDVFSGMKSSGFCNQDNKDLYMAEYEIREGDRAPNDSVMHYYYPSSEKSDEEILKKLKFIEKMGFFTETDYHLHNNIVEFHDSVPEKTRIMIKIIIDVANCRVSWCKIRAYNKIKNYFEHNK